MCAAVSDTRIHAQNARFRIFSVSVTGNLGQSEALDMSTTKKCTRSQDPQLENATLERPCRPCSQSRVSDTRIHAGNAPFHGRVRRKTRPMVGMDELITAQADSKQGHGRQGGGKRTVSKTVHTVFSVAGVGHTHPREKRTPSRTLYTLHRQVPLQKTFISNILVERLW